MPFAPGLTQPIGPTAWRPLNLHIGGQQISGFGNDGGIEFEYATQLVEDKSTADGFVHQVDNNDDRITVTITLNQHSRSVPILFALAQARCAVFVRAKRSFRSRSKCATPSCGDRHRGTGHHLAGLSLC